MTTYPIHEVEADMYAWLATDPAGTAVRALATVIPAGALRAPIAAPTVAWRSGALSAVGNITLLSGAWWVYVAHDDAFTQARILDAIAAAYPRGALAYGSTETGAYSQRVYDTTLGAWARSITIQYTRRGPTYV